MAVVALVLVGGLLWFSLRPEPMVLQGQIEAQQYMLSSKIPGRLAEVHVKRGDKVEKEQLVFRIDSPELESKLTQVTAIDRMAQSRSEEHTSELQSRGHLVCRLLLEKKKKAKLII